jgi:DNA-binding MarR family transcriptional regulator
MATKESNPPKSLGRQLNFTTGRMNALCQQRLEPYGLSLPQWVILSCLWREEETPVGALSKLVGSGLPATSRIIDRMVARGLVARRRDLNDKRVMLVKSTKEGDALDHLLDFYQEVNTVLLDGFSADEQELAFAFLLRIEQNAFDALG